MRSTTDAPWLTRCRWCYAEGRLQQPSLDLLEGADIQFRRENRLDIALVKNLPIALVFLPAADIPTFVSEGRVDLGITGLDQVQEHDSRMRMLAAAAAEAAGVKAEAGPEPVDSPPQLPSPSDGDQQQPVPVRPLQRRGTGAAANASGCETVMELGFGTCRLQVQVPVKGRYADPRDLVGRNIGTSFVHLATEYFARLEAEVDAAAAAAANAAAIAGDATASVATSEGKADAEKPSEKLDSSSQQAPTPIATHTKMRTKIIELSGSVEAACALGVADGIVDLVGVFGRNPRGEMTVKRKLTNLKQNPARQ